MNRIEVINEVRTIFPEKEIWPIISMIALRLEEKGKDVTFENIMYVLKNIENTPTDES